MTSIQRRTVLGVQIAVTDYQGATEQIIESAQARSPLGVTALAVHGVMTGVLDPVHRARLNSLDLCLPDGQPVRWALNWMHDCALRDRVYGPELMLRVCARAAEKGLPIYLYGNCAERLEKLKNSLLEQFPSLVIAGSSPSRFRKITSAEKAAVVSAIRSSGAALVFCGLGCPRQEVWTYEYRDSLGIPIVAVGAAFDFFTDTLRQAPAALQRRGLEWAYRLYAEPTRLWRRYLLLNPLYLCLVAAEWIGLKKFGAGQEVKPVGELGFG